MTQDESGEVVSTGTTSSPRILRVLDVYNAGLCIVVTLVGMASEAFLFFSSRHTEAVVLRLAAVSAIGIGTCLVLLSPRARDMGARGPGRWLLVLGVAFAAMLVLRMPPGTSRVVITALAIVLAGSAASIGFRRSGPTVSAAVLATLATLALAPELPPRANWGDRLTFRYLFRREPPLIGPGGRLRPSQSVEMGVGSLPAQPLRFETNRFGFRNSEPVARAPDRPRILSLGDSFSNGYGIDQHEFFGPVLERELATSGLVAEVLNAEVSDPAYGLYYLQNHGMRFSPHVVLYGLCGNDIVQNLWWTAEEGLFRLEEDGTLRLRHDAQPASPHEIKDRWKHLVYPRAGRAPYLASDFLWDFRNLRSIQILWRRVTGFAASRQQRGELTPNALSARSQWNGRIRFFDGYINLGFLYHEPPKLAERLYGHFFPIIRSMAETARRHGAEFVLILFPTRYEVQAQDWQALVRRWNLDERDFELGRGHRRITSFCRANGIRCLDLAPAFRRAAEEKNLYLPYDDHFNVAGHAVAAQEVARVVRRVVSLPPEVPGEQRRGTAPDRRR